MSDDQKRDPEKPYGKGHRPSILLIDGPFGGKVFEIPEHRQTADGLPQYEYWIGGRVTVTNRWTGEEDTADMVFKYELDPTTQGYRHTETREVDEVLGPLLNH